MPVSLVALELQRRYLESEGYSADFGLDRQLMRVGISEHKRFHFLESVQDSVVPFVMAPPREQQTLLNRLVTRAGEALEMMRTMEAAWRADDDASLWNAVSASISETPKTYEAAIQGRNLRWLPTVDWLVRSSRAPLIVVGALHLIGDGSVCALLEKRGFSCVRIAR